MQRDLWRRRFGCICFVAAILTCCAAVTGIAGPEDADGNGERVEEVEPYGEEGALFGEGGALFAGGGREGNRYWLGIEAREAQPSMRSQLGLKEKQGLVVGHVAPDGPAAKAGIERYDVLVKAGDAELGRVADLTKAINAAEGKEVALTLFRGGKEQTVKVTPDERPQDVVKFVRPPAMGMVFGRGMQPRPELPENMSLKIEREGKKPVKISVSRGDEKWEITEDELDKLPKDVRHLVEPLVRGGPFMVSIEGDDFKAFNVPLPPPAAKAPRAPGAPGARKWEQNLPPPGREGGPDEAGLMRRLDHLQQELQRLREEMGVERHERERRERDDD